MLLIDEAPNSHWWMRLSSACPSWKMYTDPFKTMNTDKKRWVYCWKEFKIFKHDLDARTNSSVVLWLRVHVTPTIYPTTLYRSYQIICMASLADKVASSGVLTRARNHGFNSCSKQKIPIDNFTNSSAQLTPIVTAGTSQWSYGETSNIVNTVRETAWIKVASSFRARWNIN